MDRRLLSGNEAVARGAWEAGARLGIGYPGTPSTEILEALDTYDGPEAQWAPNEKVALEVGLGAAFAGARVLVTMKHVGLNVAADPFFTAVYTGSPGGLVIVSADDPGMHSSQNEQDNRHYARFAKVPMLEPADSDECRRFVREAFDLSERFGTPVLLRLTTRLCHSKGPVAPGEPVPRPDAYHFQQDPGRYVMVPGNARRRHVAVEQRLVALAAFSEQTPLNEVIEGERSLGLIAAGVAFQYAREAAPDASFFKLGMAHPLPLRRLRAFVDSVERAVVVEELDDVVACQLRAAGLGVESKPAALRVGELNPTVVAAFLAGRVPEPAIPGGGQPPRLCPGCPHRPTFLVLRKLKAIVAGDIGCYTLGVMPPLSSMDTCICMGASIGVGTGLRKVLPADEARRVVSAIGDSTFFHSGVTGVMEAIYNKEDAVVLIFDNATTAMTGFQDHPGSGVRLSGRPGGTVDAARLCEAIGCDSVTVVDPYELDILERTLTETIGKSGVNVVILRRPCRLLDRTRRPVMIIDQEKCTLCRRCVKTGCPAIIAGEDAITIDARLCAGCGVCRQVCPADAIAPSDA